MSDRPTTVGGHDAAEVISWLQKAIRRGEEDDAVYCDGSSHPCSAAPSSPWRSPAQ